MRILVTGAQGQLARSLAKRARAYPSISLECVGRPELELCEPGRASAVVLQRRPDVVINAAAFTAVDEAEKERDAAFRINADAAGEVAAAAADIDAQIIQISTDYVFDGETDVPYRENDPTNPTNVYGSSKLAGEEAVRLANSRHLILRTSWVYSPFGRNFVTTMLRLAADRDQIRVVADQTGCPTGAFDLADTLLEIARVPSTCSATYHLAGSGECTWAEFAGHIFDASRELGGPFAQVVPIATAEYPTAAQRPRYSVLDSRSFEQRFHRKLPAWRDSVTEAVRHILAN